MSCTLCTSENQSRVPTEIAVHLPGPCTPHIFLFPEVLVCMDCGFAEFSISETELQRLRQSDLAGF
jgi:hypothetical protein